MSRESRKIESQILLIEKAKQAAKYCLAAIKGLEDYESPRSLGIVQRNLNAALAEVQELMNSLKESRKG